MSKTMYLTLESSNTLTGGLNTKQAIYRLYKDINDYLNEIQPTLHDTHSWKFILRQAYSRKSVYSTFRWTSILFLLTSTISYILACNFGHFTTSLPLTIESIILVLVLLFNTAIIFWNSRSRHLELYNKALKLTEKINECSSNIDLINQWSTGLFYPHLNTPPSPCISLQQTYRDGRLINLPLPLLVAGDVILLNPGHQVPANCRRIDKVLKRQKKLSDYNFEDNNYPHEPDHTFTYMFYGNDSMKDCTLLRGETFSPKADNVPNTFTLPRFRKAVKPCKFLVLETPYIHDLKVALSNQFNRRASTAFEKELRLIFVRYIEHALVPIIFVVVLGFSVIHYCYVEFTGSHFDTGPATIVLIILRPIMTIIPLLPLALPLLWLILNLYGLIKLDVIFENFCQNQDKIQKMANSNKNSNECIHEYHLNEMNSSNDNCIQSKQRNDYCLDEIDPESLDYYIPPEKFELKRILKEIFSFFYNDNGNLWRTANLLHVFGSITALCCIDKKGILSWPNPTADKVFFLTSQNENKKRRGTMESANQTGDDLNENQELTDNVHADGDKRNSILNSTKAECVQLDITNEHHNAQYGLQFDDIYWNRYLSNLKPLGLAILLNTCNQATQEESVQFSDHVSCEALKNEVAVSVINKRCLCELARQIGFKQNAIKGYEYCYQVGLFRHIRPEVIQKGKLAKSLNFPRLKMPFSNMTCAVIKDIFSNTSQLFSQGTGDLILDACAEYWNGQSLVLLTEYDKKKILDFYQRSSLTSYCCAFSYLPLINETVVQPSHNFHKEFYIELPPDSSHLFPSLRNLEATFRSLANDSHYFTNTSHNLDTDFINQNDYSNSMYLNTNTKLGSHHLSSDSLIKVPDAGGDQVTTDNDHRLRTKSLNQETQKLEETMKKVINEVFIGMTTLQYQACSDFVRLIELLEAACIRFVHFSKENELRSRVFSEKMGLESGWNCHISLLNDANSEEHDSNLESSELRKSSESTVHAKFYKSHGNKGSISSSSSVGSLMEQKANESDSDEELKTESSRLHHRRKHNSFSVSSERSESVISSSRYNRFKDFRSGSKASGSNSNPQRNLSPSPSRLTTTSSITDHSAPIGFDMSNRAKLPKGIDNIRPHLENVDNVPLLVSLFTDCTPDATKEMIKIMQEYDEVVCVIGSMANESNMPIFLQADASVGIEPMYPHVCTREPIFPADCLPFDNPLKNSLTPTQLANQLIALPCSLTMSRHNSIIFHRLILNSRDYMMRMRNIFQFFLSSCLSITLAQTITSLLFLPPLLSPGIVLWLSLVVIPFLSVSLMGSQHDPGVMNVATGKKLHLNKETIAYFFVCYIIKFTPSIIICVIMFAIIIGTSCGQTNVGLSTLGPCWMFSDVKANGDIKTDLIWSSHLLIGQTIASFFLVLYLVIISIGFVYRNHLLWQRSPLKNLSWVATSVVLMILHIIVCIIEIYIYVPEAEITQHFIEIIPFYIWIIAFTWPIFLISINVFTKRREIKMYSRQQRRARLEFGTKLGMNSPF